MCRWLRELAADCPGWPSMRDSQKRVAMAGTLVHRIAYIHQNERTAASFAANDGGMRAAVGPPRARDATVGGLRIGAGAFSCAPFI